ncbi:MAG TPA: molybdopterin converting factor subunit 1 [Gammaproteobacteria bacterium]|nr:molybdopterin converting factor subunit 1 [Gammaproteobacteria bacterium]
MPKISVLYFGQLREQLACGQEDLELQDPCTVAEVWQSLHPQRTLAQNILIAVNQEYVKADFVVKGGEEVAFFPPVTGG